MKNLINPQDILANMLLAVTHTALLEIQPLQQVLRLHFSFMSMQNIVFGSQKHNL